MPRIEERLVELETKASFTDLSQDQLSDTLYQQQQQIDALQKQVELLRQQLNAATDAMKDGTAWKPEDEIPPHY